MAIFREIGSDWGDRMGEGLDELNEDDFNEPRDLVWLRKLDPSSALLLSMGD